MSGALDPVERTSLLTAALRAAESGREDRLFEDPHAARLAGEAGFALLREIREATFPPGGGRSAPSTPDYNAIRTRFLDDYLQRAARRDGAPQIVLAPAGMDSRAYRLRWPAGTRWFELDRPAVLAHKQQHLASVQPRAERRAVALDLTSPAWEEDLLAAGYEPERPSVWLLEGLLYYLGGPDAHRLLARVAALMAPGSRIAADLVNAAALTLPDVQVLLDVFARWGCPWVFGTDEPEELFGAHGFKVEALQPGDPQAGYGRWPDPVPPRSAAGVRRVFFVHGKKQPA
ncbi:methyltransferase (TIGR00027 family) [Streptomyces sp. V3I8]|uniref:SAM-dependent methyltransferase n=1 Tax=Streptomyces sp. V3I8 TaxID=3042279 RepID=UPI002780312B|nr:SAM-dependent methyltransferase [Streptomyces sp. V3I8]MDQ1041710.1 methyltransferase (TIGR00027 family) [Streptomyces sp. V3I8]